MTDVSAHDLVVRRGPRVVLTGIDLAVTSGTIIGLVGPNGSGKSTLLRSLYRVVEPDAGVVLVGGSDVWRDLTPRRLARTLAVVGQERPSEFAFTVGEVVMTGRTPHHRIGRGDTRGDVAVVEDALARVGMGEHTNRPMSELSGGEKQRVLLARALAQQPTVLVLDEPTNHLDIRAQLEIMELVAGLGVTTVMAVHELTLAAAYCDRIVLIDQGRIVADGDTRDVLDSDLLSAVFGVRVHCGDHPLTGRLQLSFAPADTPSPPTNDTKVAT
ncbi:ABC transporter ATP-binding protein [Rhodococcus triatomae]|nr:ABC transporter ATP-binding protein [Rhodococcus triatomae BKS 15-14]